MLPQYLHQLDHSAHPGGGVPGTEPAESEVHEFDLVDQQEVGKGTVVSVSYLGALGKKLPNFLDVNMDPTTDSDHPDHRVRLHRQGPLPERNGLPGEDVYQVWQCQLVRDGRHQLSGPSQR